jgi:hypothetical protein
MKNSIVYTFLCATLLIPYFSYSQQLKTPAHQVEEDEYEKPDDPYMPNPYNNQKLSPAYSYDNHTQSRTGGTEIFTRQVNVTQNQQNIVGDAANEPNIAVNPLNENEIVIGWRQFDSKLSNFRQAGWAYSSDGGKKWIFRGSINPGSFQSDPVLDYDYNGNFYYNSLASTSAVDWPCFIYKSTDKGITWDTGVYIGGGDKQWMAIDRSGGIGEGNIYSSWSPVNNDCPPGFFTRSTDGGNSFEPCSYIPDEPSSTSQTVGNNGELYIAGRSPLTQAAKVAKSIDAQDATQAVNWDQVTTCNLRGFFIIGAPINPVGSLGQVYIDVDRSNGPGRDNVYVAATVKPYFNSDPGDMMFNMSTNGGMTWNLVPPIKINDDPDTTNTQWLGTMSVAPNGRIDVIWLDTRDNPGSDSSALYYSYSIDQGATWSANEKLSESFDPHIGYPNQAKMGDYFDMISTNTGAHLAWVHTLNDEQDVYYSFITPPALTGTDEVGGIVNATVYPNPTDGPLEISSGDKKVRIEIFTAVGNKIFSSSDFDTRHVIDIASQPAGIYFLKMISEDNRETIQKIARK